MTIEDTEPMTVDDAIRRACVAMDEASPDGKQLPRGPAGQELVETIELLRIACGNAPEFSQCIGEPLIHLYPYDLLDLLEANRGSNA